MAQIVLSASLLDKVGTGIGLTVIVLPALRAEQLDVVFTTLTLTTSAFAKVEYTFPLIEKVRGAVFYDAGVVDAESWEFGNGIYHDAGFGLRLNLPFGPLAIDYAIPLGTPGGDDAEADQGGQFHFYLDYKF